MKLDGIKESWLPGVRSQRQARQTQTDAHAAVPGEPVSLSRPLQVGQKILGFSLERHLVLGERQFSASVSDGTAAVDENTDPFAFDFEAVADKVMTFVGNAIRAKQADGGDTSQLQGLLAQARKGIDLGFGSARKELAGALEQHPELGEGIDKSYELIQKRMGEFEQQLFGPAPTDTASEVAPADLDAKGRQHQRGTLELTTRDGDRVTLTFDDKQKWRLQQGHVPPGQARKALQAYGAGQSAMRQEPVRESGSAGVFYSHTSKFSFAVEGELDDGELKAIGELVGQLGDLADTFFAGDLPGALEQAAELDSGNGELASLTFRLQQQQNLHMTGSQAAGGSEGDDPLAPLAGYLTQLQQVTRQLSSWLDDGQGGALSQWVVAQQQGLEAPALDEANRRFADFNRRLSQMAA